MPTHLTIKGLMDLTVFDGVKRKELTMRKGVKVYGIKIPMLLLLIAVSIALLSCDAARDLVPALPLSKQANAAIDSTCVSDVTGAAVFT